jgi:hypothetical protein
MAIGVFLSIIFVGLQVGLIIIQQYALMHVTRESARWLAIRPDTQDAALITHVQAEAVRTVTLRPANFTAIAPAPVCDWGGDPAHCQQRHGGEPIQLTITYDLSDQIFLPPAMLSAFGISTSARQYAVAIMIE